MTDTSNPFKLKLPVELTYRLGNCARAYYNLPKMGIPLHSPERDNALQSVLNDLSDVWEELKSYEVSTLELLRRKEEAQELREADARGRSGDVQYHDITKAAYLYTQNPSPETATAVNRKWREIISERNHARSFGQLNLD